jgi:hypothetical protein
MQASEEEKDPASPSGGGGGEIATLHSITLLGAGHVGKVVIAASHGGVYAGHCAALGGVRAVILNDAGVGRDRAGIGSLDYLEGLGLAAATADSRSCRIGDGDDMRDCGIVSHVNPAAAALGCAPGQRVADCAGRLRGATPTAATVPPHAEARFVARDRPGEPRVIVMDSVSLVESADAGAIVITASHGGLLGGDPASALKVEALAAIYCDAGFGKDRAGITRLPALDRRGIAAATVSAESARIGDGRSVHADGVLSCVNETAAAMGIVVGDAVQAFVDKVTRAQSPGLATH